MSTMLVEGTNEVIENNTNEVVDDNKKNGVGETQQTELLDNNKKNDTVDTQQDELVENNKDPEGKKAPLRPKLSDDDLLDQVRLVQQMMIKCQKWYCRCVLRPYWSCEVGKYLFEMKTAMLNIYYDVEHDIEARLTELIRQSPLLGGALRGDEFTWEDTRGDDLHSLLWQCYPKLSVIEQEAARVLLNDFVSRNPIFHTLREALNSLKDTCDSNFIF